jgi:hypothetical protein
MIKATNTGKTREPIPAGTYLARCYSIAHIGTEFFEYQGEPKQTNKVRFTFELPTKLKVFKEGEEAKPLAIGEEYGISTHEKSNLRKVMNSWRGKDFTEEEVKSFDVTSMISKPCLITISITDKGYNKITGISSLMEGQTCPEQINPTQLFDYEENFDNLSKLPTFIQDKIKKTPEYVKKVGVETVDTDLESLDNIYNELNG